MCQMFSLQNVWFGSGWFQFVHNAYSYDNGLGHNNTGFVFFLSDQKRQPKALFFQTFCPNRMSLEPRWFNSEKDIIWKHTEGISVKRI